MSKFFVSPSEIFENSIVLTRENALHISVLRYMVGDCITVCDGESNDFNCEILTIEKKQVVLKINSQEVCKNEPKIKITIFQALPKSDKMELIIQKCVELGVHNIVPFESEHCIAKRKSSAKNDGKINRWGKISEVAAKQCGRGIIPKISETMTFLQAINHARSLEKNFVAYENEENFGIKQACLNFDASSLGVFIGPEGGFSKAEIELCVQNNILPLTLGKRILRTETAAFAAILLFLFNLGD